MKNKNLCIIQARVGSSRLPGKVLKKVKGITLLEYCINKVKMSKMVDKIVVATTTEKGDERIVKLCQKIRIPFFRGSESDVLDRYFQCSLQYSGYKNIVRITSDCPLIDPVLVDQVINYFLDSKLDYASNVFKKVTFPDGMDTEVFTVDALHESAQKAKLSSEREHATQYIIKHKKFKKGGLFSDYDWSHFRMTVDNKEDFEVAKFLIENSKKDAEYLDYISLLTKNPHIMLKNAHITRNEGLLKSLREDKKIKRKK